ncbi:MAG: OmpH family outer membrane protein [Gemmatimonadota bacterium]
MRAFFRAVPFALGFVAALSGSASAQGQKLAYVTTSILVEQAPGRADAETAYQKEADVFKAEIKRMSDSLDAMIAAYQKVQPTLTAAQRDTREKDLGGKQAAYQQRTRDIEAKANQRQNELVGPVMDRIKLAIEDVRIEGGYSFIFNAEQGSPIVAFDKNLNVTDRVLAKLRASSAAAAPKTTAPAPAPSGVTRPPTNPPMH